MSSRLSLKKLSVPLLFLLLYTGTSLAGNLDTLEELVGQWLELRQQITQSANTWTGEQQQLKDEQQRLLAHQESLQTNLKRLEEQQDGLLKDIAQTQTDNTRLETALADLVTLIERATEYVNEHHKHAPGFLLSALRESTSTDNPVSSEKTSATSLGQILQQLDRIELVNQQVHYGRQLVTMPDSTTREIETLLIGTGYALGVSTDNQMAGSARPAADGWQWTWNNQWTKPIRRAIDIHRQKRKAELTPLPINIPEVSQ